jgi:hypothetical protein
MKKSLGVPVHQVVQRSIMPAGQSQHVLRILFVDTWGRHAVQ